MPELLLIRSSTFGVGDQVAPADDDHVGRRERHLAHQVARDENGPALGRQRLHERADPDDAFGVEAVDRLVEDQDGRVPEQRPRYPEALGHAERESAGPSVGDVAQADEIEHFVDPLDRDAARLGQGQQVVPCLAPGLVRLGVEDGADFTHRGTQVVGRRCRR